MRAVIPVGTPFEIEKNTPPKYKPWNNTPLNNDQLPQLNPNFTINALSDDLDN